MKTFLAIPSILFATLLGAGCTSESLDRDVSDAEVMNVQDVVRAAEPALELPDKQDDSVKSFEFLGCSGEWPNEDRLPEVWRTESERGTYFVARHSDDCGYNIGMRPTAAFVDGVLELNYVLTNTSGEAAACLCEYWARFELAAEPEDIKSVSLNGAPARLKGDLAGR